MTEAQPHTGLSVKPGRPLDWLVVADHDAARAGGRVLEHPTSRRVLDDNLRLGAEIPKEAKLIHQERAYISPIWYKPS